MLALGLRVLLEEVCVAAVPQLRTELLTHVRRTVGRFESTAAVWGTC